MSKFWHSFADEPKVGRRIVAIYNDGSGAVLLYRTGQAYIDEDGCEKDVMGNGFSMWAYLPANVKLWCEVRKYSSLQLDSMVGS
jgi:hypothetical protein